MRSSWRTLKKLGKTLEHIKNTRYNNGNFTSVNLYYQDESRFGLLTRQRRVLTIRGVKPVCPFQHKFETTYLFGSFSAINGSSFLLELPYCNTDAFQLYLDEFSLQKPDELKIIILDNGAFHKARRLRIPSNIALIFLPPYSPELNPAERVWRFLKDEISMKAFPSLQKLQDDLSKLIRGQLTISKVKSLTGNRFYLNEFMSQF
jgi:transposase